MSSQISIYTTDCLSYYDHASINRIASQIEDITEEDNQSTAETPPTDLETNLLALPEDVMIVDQGRFTDNSQSSIAVSSTTMMQAYQSTNLIQTMKQLPEV